MYPLGGVLILNVIASPKFQECAFWTVCVAQHTGMCPCRWLPSGIHVPVGV